MESRLERFKAKTAQALAACIDAAVAVEVLRLSMLDWRLGLHVIAVIGMAMSLVCAFLASALILRPLWAGFLHLMFAFGLSGFGIDAAIEGIRYGYCGSDWLNALFFLLAGALNFYLLGWLVWPHYARIEAAALSKSPESSPGTQTTTP